MGPTLLCRLRDVPVPFMRPRTADLLGRPNAGSLAGSGYAPAGPEGLAEPIEEEEGGAFRLKSPACLSFLGGGGIPAPAYLGLGGFSLRVSRWTRVREGGGLDASRPWIKGWHKKKESQRASL